jgi:3-methyladenine DNA glycosylase AlkC
MTLTHPIPARLAGTLCALALLAACNPTVKIQAPDKPIEINLNIHIDQVVRVKVDNELNDAFKDHPELFGPAGEKAAGTAKK